MSRDIEMLVVFGRRETLRPREEMQLGDNYCIGSQPLTGFLG